MQGMDGKTHTGYKKAAAKSDVAAAFKQVIVSLPKYSHPPAGNRDSAGFGRWKSGTLRPGPNPSCSSSSRTPRRSRNTSRYRTRWIPWLIPPRF